MGHLLNFAYLNTFSTRPLDQILVIFLKLFLLWPFHQMRLCIENYICFSYFLIDPNLCSQAFFVCWLVSQLNPLNVFLKKNKKKEKFQCQLNDGMLFDHNVMFFFENMPKNKNLCFTFFFEDIRYKN
jgi:hypothetical protein